MSVHAFPVTKQRQADIKAALEQSDVALNELLRQAVVAYTAGGLRVVGSLSHRHHIEIAGAYLHSIEIILGRPGLAAEMNSWLADGVHDIRLLASYARAFDSNGPYVA